MPSRWIGGYDHANYVHEEINIWEIKLITILAHTLINMQEQDQTGTFNHFLPFSCSLILTENLQIHDLKFLLKAMDPRQNDDHGRPWSLHFLMGVIDGLPC